MSTVTLIGEKLAEPGTEFVYEGEASGCEGCPYRNQCLNLEPGKPYRVVSVREGAQRLPCNVHADDVVAVEVEPTTFMATVPSRTAYAGNRSALAGPCPYIECPSHDYCVPAAADFDSEYQIVNVEGKPPHETCHLDRDLELVELSADT